MNNYQTAKSKQGQRQRGLLVAGIIGLIFSLMGAIFVPPNPTLALNGNIDPNSDGTVSVFAPTPSGSHFATIDDGIPQPTVPNTSDYISALSNSGGVDFIRLSSVSGVQTVFQLTLWAFHNDGANALFTAELYDDNETLSRSSPASFTQLASNGWNSVTFSGLALNQSQLDTLSIRLSISKSGGGPNATGFLYALYADVQYDSVPSIILTSNGSIDFGHQAPNTTQDTTASGLNDVQTIFIEGGPVDLDVRSSVFSDGSNNWTLAGAAGANQVKWEFSPDGNTWTTISAPNTLFTLANNLPVDTNQNFYLRLTMPTSTASLNQRGATVTVVLSTP